MSETCTNNWAANHNAYCGVEHQILSQTADLRTALEKTAGEGRITAEREGSLTRAAVREATCDLEKSTRDGFCGLEKSTRDGFSTARVDTVSGFKDALRDAERLASASLLNQEKIAAAQALTACQNAAAIAKQVAECCCETKELVRSEAGQTRELALKIEADRNARELQDTKNELAFLRLQCCPPCGTARPAA